MNSQCLCFSLITVKDKKHMNKISGNFRELMKKDRNNDYSDKSKFSKHFAEIHF